MFQRGERISAAGTRRRAAVPTTVKAA